METKLVIIVLTALAQESRLAIFRLLVRAGAAGLPAGKIAEKLDIPTSSLSFHLKELTHASLISPKHQSRSIIYSANFSTINDVLKFLTENCCNGNPCLPDCNIECPTPKENPL